MTQKMAPSHLQGLLLFVLSVAVSEGRDISIVVASQGEDVALPCFNSHEMDPKSCYRVRWLETDAGQMEIILARPKSSEIPDAKRVEWEADGNGWMSLFLTKVQKSDKGQYSCEVWQGWERVLVKNITLIVKECRTLRAVKAESGASVNLTCPVDMTSGHHGPCNISWVMLKGGNPVSVNPKRVNINGTSLAIQAVSHSNSGWYRCKYMLGETQHCFEVNLLVQEEKEEIPEVDIAVMASTHMTSTIPALTASEAILETRTLDGSGAFIAVVTSVFVAVAISAAQIRLLIYITSQKTQRHPLDPCIVSTVIYKIVDLTPSEDPETQ